MSPASSPSGNLSCFSRSPQRAGPAVEQWGPSASHSSEALAELVRQQLPLPLHTPFLKSPRGLLGVQHFNVQPR